MVSVAGVSSFEGLLWRRKQICVKEADLLVPLLIHPESQKAHKTKVHEPGQIAA